MKSIINDTWLRRQRGLFASMAIALTACCFLPAVSLALPQRNVIRPKIQSIASKTKPQRKVVKVKRPSTALKAKPQRKVVKVKIQSVTSKAKPQGNAIAQKMQMLKRSNQRWIQINLSRQRLIAWQGKKPVYSIIVSTGKNSTPTLPGVFAIASKYPSVRMKGSDYDVPNVPYTMFYDGLYAIHGAYWHKKFGTRVSHGCTNLAVNHAKWLYNWSIVGTPVVVNK